LHESPPKEHLELKRNFLIGLSAFLIKTTAICLDKFNGISDELEGAAILAILTLPFVLIECADHSDPGALVEIG
jgi:hypothetical protein